MRRGLIVGFALSAAFHVLLFHWPVRRAASAPPPATVVWRQSDPPPPVRHASRGRGGGRARGLSLRELGLGRALGDLKIGASGADPRGSTGSAVLDRLRDAGSDTSLYDRIDQALQYPDEIADAHIEGTVRATILFDAEGRYRRDRS